MSKTDEISAQLVEGVANAAWEAACAWAQERNQSLMRERYLEIFRVAVSSIAERLKDRDDWQAILAASPLVPPRA